MKLFVHLGDGPVWYQPDYNGCTKNWWYNLLYISNTIERNNICVGLTWHVSVDMMWYILSPIFILPLYYAPYIGIIFVSITIIGATAYIGVVAASNGFMGAISLDPDYNKLFSILYGRPIFWTGPYLTGILLGYLLHRNYRSGQKIVPLGKWFKFMMWSIAIFLYTAAAFGTYGDFSGIRPFTDIENASYLMFSGLALSISLFIVIYMCNTGHGGVVNSFLSWPGWEPLVKLSYSVFLVHFMVLYFVFGTLQSSLILTDTVIVVLVVAVLVICFKLAGMKAREK